MYDKYVNKYMNICICKYIWVLTIYGDSFICRTKMYDNNKSQELESPDALTVIQSGKCNKLS